MGVVCSCYGNYISSLMGGKEGERGGEMDEDPPDPVELILEGRGLIRPPNEPSNILCVSVRENLRRHVATLI